MRFNPFGRGSFHFEDLISFARKGHQEVVRRGLEPYLPDYAIEEATQANGFPQKHATRRVPDWSPYFTALREWLGLSESRNTKQHATTTAAGASQPGPEGAEPTGAVDVPVGRAVGRRAVLRGH